MPISENTNVIQGINRGSTVAESLIKGTPGLEAIEAWQTAMEASFLHYDLPGVDHVLAAGEVAFGAIQSLRFQRLGDASVKLNEDAMRNAAGIFASIMCLPEPDRRSCGASLNVTQSQLSGDIGLVISDGTILWRGPELPIVALDEAHLYSTIWHSVVEFSARAESV